MNSPWSSAREGLEILRPDPRAAGASSFPLTTMQLGMLFQTLHAEGSGVDVQQIVCTLREELEEETFAAAWSRVLARHLGLRVSFSWEGLPAPRQVVHESVEMPIAREDWRGLAPAERERRLPAFLAADRRRGFDVARPPLMRLLLVRWDEGEHRVVWTLHHMLADGRSYALVLREVFEIYEALRRGREPSLAAPAAYERFLGWLETRDPAASEPFWRARLAGFREPTPLPLDRRPRRGEAWEVEEEGSEERRLPRQVVARLQELGGAHGLTPHTFVQGAWAWMLHRYTGARDVVFGSIRAGRKGNVPGTESMVGAFFNNLPVRVRIEPHRPLLAWLADLRAEGVALREGEHTPLADIQSWSEVPPGRRLFETLVSFERFELDHWLRGLGGPWAARRFEVRRQVGYPLSLGASLGGGSFGGSFGMVLSLSYARGRFARSDAQRLLRMLAGTLTAMAHRPEGRLRELARLPEEERAQVLVEWNDTGPTALPEAPLAAGLDARAAEAPDAVALVEGERRLTRAELLRSSTVLARRLRRLGVAPETRVALVLERGIAQAVAEEAVWRAGGAFVPLSPAEPPRRLAWTLAASGARWVVTSRGDLTAVRPLAPDGARVIALEEREEPGELEGPETQEAGGRFPDAGPESLAYVLFTSGSTGRPKGVLVRRGSVAAHARAVARRYGLGPGDRVLQLAAPGFDVAVEELFPTLWSGACAVFPPPTARTSIAAFLDTLTAHGVTVVNLPASFWHEWVARLDRDGREGREPVRPSPSLRLVVTGSEEVASRSVRRWRTRLGDGIALVNAYGLTEATVTSTVYGVGTPGPAAEAGPLPIGRPVAGCRVYLLDPELDPVPLGAPGALAVAGTGLARGYVDDPRQTADRFRPDPFAAEPGARLYRTGDVARFRDDGCLEFLGRADRQLEIHGIRVEPGEIEAVLAEHPRVAHAAVVAHGEGGEAGESAETGGSLTAYVVASGEPAPGDGELRSFLAPRLPPVMVPERFVRLPELPLTPGGKLDRRRLPRPEPEDHPGERSGTAPRTHLEALVATLWSEVLERPEIGRDENFFALGGHSLRAARLLERVARELGVELPVRSLFEHPTVAGLAAQIERSRRGGGAAAAAEPTEPLLPTSEPGAEPDGEPPLSFAQERLWVLEQLGGSAGVYNVPLGLRLEGAVNLAALEGSLRRIVARHEPLRSRFPASEGRPRLELAPPRQAEPRLPVVDLQGLDPRRRAAELGRLRRGEMARGFDLGRGPLLRTLLIRLGDAVGWLGITVHHIAFDGGSEALLLRELESLYRETAAGRPDRLPALPLRYRDFAGWQRRRLRGERLEALLSAARRRLAGAPQTLELPADRPRGAARRFRGAKRFFTVPPATRDAVTAVSRSRAVTPFMVTLAALAVLCSRLTAQRDLLLGSPVGQRDRRELEGLVGLFVNLLVLRVEISPGMTGGELLEQVRERVLEAYDQRDLPFERLVQELAEERRTEHAPLVQVVLAYEADPRTAPRLPGLTARLEDVDTGRTKFDLTLSLDEGETGERETGGREKSLGGFLGYRSDLFSSATAGRFLAAYLRLLGALAENPEAPLDALPLLSAAERHQLLVEWSGRETPYPRQAGIAAVFEARAAERPEAVAVEHGETRLTYGELDRAADRLAAALERRGVGPETLVGVLLDRSPEAVVALLAILKAGGAYLPLDPALPAARLRRMLADAGSRVVVTDRPDHPGLPEGLETVAVGRNEAAGAAEAPGVAVAGRPTARAGGGNLAYVLYTSGSTGRPKGVAVEQRSVLRLVLGADYARFGPDEVVLQLAPLSFDASTFEIWGPLLHGGRLVLFPGRRVSLAEVADTLGRRGITTLWLTAALFHQMVDDHLPQLAGVRQLLAGGDRLSPGHVRRAAAALGPGVLINGYGPTEGTTFTTCHRVGREIEDAGSVPIGRPIANTRVYVLDRGGRPVPVGVAGELWVGGDGVARGYWRRPAQTAASFRPDPFGGRPGARLYRTGDRVRWRADGSLDFLGRFDDQVKVRGFRVEPGEIEAALAAHPAVGEAVVAAVESPGGGAGAGGKDLVAWVVPGNGGSLSPERLRGFLAETLPAYMIPAFLLTVPELPVSATGKVDRRELLRRHPPLPPRERRGEPQLGPLETRVAEIWAAVLGGGGLGPDDDFFDLGGHSLKATQILARLDRALGVRLPLETIFRASRLGDFCRQVERRLGEGGEARPPEGAIAALPRRPRSRGGGA